MRRSILLLSALMLLASPAGALGATTVKAIRFLEGNSNLGDAARLAGDD